MGTFPRPQPGSGTADSAGSTASKAYRLGEWLGALASLWLGSTCSRSLDCLGPSGALNLGVAEWNALASHSGQTKQSRNNQPELPRKHKTFNHTGQAGQG